MKYSRYHSKNPHVDHFFIVESDDLIADPKTIQLFPDGKSVVVFNLTGVFKEKDEKLPNFLLSSACTSSHLLTVSTGKIELVGVHFKAHGLYPFLNYAMKEIAGEIHSLELIFGSEVYEIMEQMHYEIDNEKRIQILELFLQRKMRKELPNSIINVISEIDREQGNMSVRQIIGKYGLSERTLERYFEAYIGINPKKYLRLVRFQSIVDTLKNTPIQNLTALAYQFGYADQSHFIKEFQEFSHINPSNFQKNLPLSDFYNFEH